MFQYSTAATAALPTIVPTLQPAWKNDMVGFCKKCSTLKAWLFIDASIAPKPKPTATLMGNKVLKLDALSINGKVSQMMVALTIMTQRVLWRKMYLGTTKDANIAPNAKQNMLRPKMSAVKLRRFCSSGIDAAHRPFIMPSNAKMVNKVF